MTYDKKPLRTESPKINALQAVIIDKNTTIYISLDADPDEARQRYLNRHLRLRT
jgi:pantothenate kinase